MNNNVDGNDLLKHLTFWHNKTDDECIELATNEYGLDAVRALLNMLERDFCTDVNNNIVKELTEQVNLDKNKPDNV